MEQVGGRRLGLLSLFAMRDILVDLHELCFEDNPVGLETREHVDEVRLCICGSGFPISRPTRRRRRLPETEGGGTMRGAAGPQHMPRSNPSEFSLGSPVVCYAHAGPLLVDAATGRGKKCCVWDGIRETLEACGEVFFAAKLSTGRGKPR